MKIAATAWILLAFLVALPASAAEAARVIRKTKKAQAPTTAVPESREVKSDAGIPLKEFVSNYAEVPEPRLSRLGVELLTDMMVHVATEIGLGGRFVYRPSGPLHFDLEASLLNTQFGNIFTSPTSPEASVADPAIQDPASEFNRVRSGSDPWRLLRLGAGVTVGGPLLTGVQSRFTVVGRFGLARLIAQDQQNDLTFNGYFFSGEVGLLYRLLKQQLHPFVRYEYGLLRESTTPSTILGTLPFHRLAVGFGVVFGI